MEVLRHKSVRMLRTEVDWADRDLVHFLAGAGFGLAPARALGRAVRAESREVER